MFRLSKPFLSFTAGALVLGILTLSAPRAAHAIAAVLVQVTNTAANPVPNKDVDTPGRHPYQQSCESVGGTEQVGFLDCYMPVVPANTEVVIQTVSMQLYGTTIPQASYLFTFGGGVQITTYLPLLAQANPFYMTTQPLTAYVDPGASASCGSQTTSSSNPSVILRCTITGYTVSLP